MDSKHIIAFHREYVDVTGSITAALMLSQAVYWTQKTDDGWFYKNQADWEDETGLTRTEYTTARKRLRHLPCWQEDRHGPRGTIRFRVDMAQLQSSGFLQAESISLQDSCNSVYRNPVNQSSGILQTPYTESTTESTTESKGTRETPQPTKSEPQTPPPENATSEKTIPQRNRKRITSPHFGQSDFVDGLIPSGKGVNAVQVYYERFEIARDKARLRAPQEDDLVRLCPDLDKLRDVITAYSRKTYQPGNIQLILDWYRDGIPVHQNGNGQPVSQQTEAAFSMEALTQ